MKEHTQFQLGALSVSYYTQKLKQCIKNHKGNDSELFTVILPHGQGEERFHIIYISQSRLFIMKVS